MTTKVLRKDCISCKKFKLDEDNYNIYCSHGKSKKRKRLIDRKGRHEKKCKFIE